ncbi:GL19423 [Drosophila persimilis]|uniref:GL19423 n=1 Tax=Drosophila persimilis TaxID=7234 RepID=B4ISF1_DROPE|nr:GL19423 [Drosophila persimilis]
MIRRVAYGDVGVPPTLRRPGNAGHSYLNCLLGVPRLNVLDDAATIGPPRSL